MDTCVNCDKDIEPDDGGAIWYHVETREMACDPAGEEQRDRMAEPYGPNCLVCGNPSGAWWARLGL